MVIQHIPACCAASRQLTALRLDGRVCLSLETLLDREEHRDDLFGRRVGVARRLNNVSSAARALISAVSIDHLPA